MTPDKLNTWADFSGIAVLLVLIFYGLSYMAKRKENQPAVLFGFALICHCLSDIYYLLYCLIKDADRMPHFSATEIGCIGYLTLFGIFLKWIYPRKEKHPLISIYMGLYLIANGVLWYLWSGDAAVNLMLACGASYFAAQIGACLSEYLKEQTFRKVVWLCYSLSFLLFQCAMYLFRGSMVQTLLDPVCPAMVIMGDLRLLHICMKCSKEGDTKGFVIFSFSLYLWNILGMWMSTGYAYTLFDALLPVISVIQFYAVGKEVSGK